MMILRQVAGNAAFLSVAHVFNPLTSILLVSAVARTQGVEALGKYSLVLAIFYMAVNAAGLGLGTPITRAVAIERRKASDYLMVSAVVGLVTGIVAMAGVRVLVSVMGYSPEIVGSATLLIWAVVPSVMISYLEAILMGFQRAPAIAAISISENIIKVIAGLILLAMGKDILSIFSTIVVLRFLTFATYLAFFSLRIAPITLQFNWNIFAELRRVSPVFTSNLLVGAIFGRIDLLILSKLASIADLGYYSAALRIVEIARLVPRNYKRAALPAMALTYRKEPETCKHLFSHSVLYMVVFGFAATIGIILFSELLVRLLYGDDFTDAQTPLKILALIMLPAALTPIFASILFAANLERLDFFANIGRILVLAVLCFVMAPVFGGLGTAAALVASEIMLLVCLAFFVQKQCFDVPLFHSLTWPFVGTLGAYAVATVTDDLPALATGILAMTVFTVVVFGFQADLRNGLTSFATAAKAKISQQLRPRDGNS